MMGGMHPRRKPRLVYADAAGQIYDHPELEAMGVDGPEPTPIPKSEWVPVPRGSDLFTLPGRSPVGRRPAGAPTVFDEPGTSAVAVFLAPAHTLTYLPAFRARPAAPTLPTFAYAALGYADDAFWTTAVRVDPDPRQDPWRFDQRRLQKQVASGMAAAGTNRLIAQLERCALDYGCRAAQNFFIGRHEAPLPTSISCNAQCVGCISLQPDGEFRASHDRLDEPPTAGEVAEVALSHLERVPEGVVSFGHGCEGEPLLLDGLLREAVMRIRRATKRGTLHLNTNASRPEVVRELAEAGLDSMRISLNSPRPAVYDAYYQPRGYSLADVEASAQAMTRRQRFVSLNYLVFPGISDTEDEFEAFVQLIQRTGIGMVQWRNLNIDPDLYRRSLPAGTIAPGFGMRSLMTRLSEHCPALRYGYFNPALERPTAVDDDLPVEAPFQD